MLRRPVLGPRGSAQGRAVGAAVFLGGAGGPGSHSARRCAAVGLPWSRCSTAPPPLPGAPSGLGRGPWPAALTRLLLLSPQAHGRPVPHKRGPGCRVTPQGTDLTPRTHAEEVLQGSCRRPPCALRSPPCPADRPERRAAQRWFRGSRTCGMRQAADRCQMASDSVVTPRTRILVFFCVRSAHDACRHCSS